MFGCLRVLPQVRLCPETNRWALSCDLGASRVWIYGF
eukprot:SAG31_NODE_34609_length_331_cov_0.883621_2_plen_36_part_01